MNINGLFIVNDICLFAYEVDYYVIFTKPSIRKCI